MTRRGDAITTSDFPLGTAHETNRDSKNVDRAWRRWKASHLIRTDWVLARLLGRPIK